MSVNYGQQQQYGAGSEDRSIPMLIPSQLLPVIPVVMALLAFIIWKKLNAREQTRSEKAMSYAREHGSSIAESARDALHTAREHVESTSSAAARAASGAAQAVSGRVEEQAQRLHR